MVERIDPVVRRRWEKLKQIASRPDEQWTPLDIRMAILLIARILHSAFRHSQDRGELPPTRRK